MTSLAERSKDDDPSLQKRWKVVTLMRNQFWMRWSREYLANLTQRRKWLVDQPNIEVDDVVWLKEDNQPPLQWPHARVIKVHYGNDGANRDVTLKANIGTYIRPVSMVVSLPKNQPPHLLLRPANSQMALISSLFLCSTPS